MEGGGGGGGRMTLFIFYSMVCWSPKQKLDIDSYFLLLEVGITGGNYLI